MDISREDFKNTINELVRSFTDNFNGFNDNPQIRVDPATGQIELIRGTELLDELAEADETIEIGAAAENSNSEEASDNAVSHIPDFYTVKSLTVIKDGRPTPSESAIDTLTARYFG